MKKMIVAFLLLMPLQAFAEHMDVIEFRLKENCSFSQYMQIVAEFNEWGKEYDYQTQIASPIQNENLVSMYWLGVSANAEAFGKAWDAWRDAQSDPNSVAAKLQARFSACEENLSRHGYDLY